jgi:hypothetical protein
MLSSLSSAPVCGQNGAETESVESSGYVQHLLDGISVAWKLKSDSIRDNAIVESDHNTIGAQSWIQSSQMGVDIAFTDSATDDAIKSVSLNGLFELGLCSHKVTNMVAKFQFSSGRRIVGIKLGRSLKLDKIFVEPSVLDPSRFNNGEYEYHVVLLPSEVQLFAATGQLDTFTEVCRISNLSWTKTCSSSHIEDSESVRSFESVAFRAKSYKLSIRSVHSRCLLLRKSSLSRSSFDYQWKNTTDMVSIQTTSANTSFSVSLISDFTFLESALDVDVLQELHACHNLTRAVKQIEDCGADVATELKFLLCRAVHEGDPLVKLKDMNTQEITLNQNIHNTSSSAVGNQSSEAVQQFLLKLNHRLSMIEQQVRVVTAFL